MTTRLTATQIRDRAMTEDELQTAVTDLAAIYGWSYVHFRAGFQASGRYHVAVTGPLGKGWPDLFLARPRTGQAIAVELKRELKYPTAEQVAVLATLHLSGIPAYVWRPSDLDSGAILEVLR